MLLLKMQEMLFIGASGLSAPPMHEGLNDELLHVPSLCSRKIDVFRSLNRCKATACAQITAVRCEMGNRAVEMMVDTGAQTSARWRHSCGGFCNRIIADDGWGYGLMLNDADDGWGTAGT